MSFVSFEFLGFFAAVLAGLAVMPTRAARLFLLLIANIVFYGSSSASSLAILTVPSLVDYACAIRIEGAADPATKRRWLVLSLATNLGILAYFKYANFFGDTIAALLGVSAARLDILLPVGISFFTFKTMSYTIDVYRGRLRACRSAWRYAMFVSFFPELVAGPIVRASVFLPQMERPIRIEWSRVTSGLRIILLGITKKMLIADRLASYVDVVFANPGSFSQGAVAAGVVAYSIQIYCDFSGYSDMAVGIARIIGFDLPMNFDMPYLSRSVTEFWRRGSGGLQANAVCDGNQGEVRGSADEDAPELSERDSKAGNGGIDDGHGAHYGRRDYGEFAANLAEEYGRPDRDWIVAGAADF